MLYTLKIRLYPSSEQANQLLKTMERFNAACNDISHIAFQNKIFRKTILQGSAIMKFATSSNYRLKWLFVLSLRSANPITLHTFQPHSAIVYDDRILTVKSIDTVSVLTLGGRISVPMSVCEYHARILNNALKIREQTDLGTIDGKFYLFHVAELPDKP